MGNKLVTIATFDQPAQARLAKNALDEAGIPASVSDENLVAMDWLLSNAVGGVKVQVFDQDADRAVDVLENKFGEQGEGLGVKMSPEELAAQAEAATPDEGEERPERAPPEPAPEMSAPLSERDDYARRLVFAGWLGLAFPPIAFFAFYLWLNAAFGEGELSPRGRYNLFVGSLTVIPAFLVGLLLLKVFPLL